MNANCGWTVRILIFFKYKLMCSAHSLKVHKYQVIFPNVDDDMRR